MADQELIADLMRAVGTDDPDVLVARVHYDRLAIKDSEAAYGVYVQVNKDNYLTAVDSDAFIPDLSWWIKVDSGTGELYKYARVNYCPKGLQTDGGFNYKLVDGVVVYAPQVEQPEGHNETASQEEFFVASRKYEPGELISIQGRMYEATSIILTGSKIIPDSNVKEVILEQYINKKVQEATA